MAILHHSLYLSLHLLKFRIKIVFNRSLIYWTKVSMESDQVCLVLLSVWVFLGHHFRTPSVLPLVPAGVMSSRQALTGFEHLQ